MAPHSLSNSNRPIFACSRCETKGESFPLCSGCHRILDLSDPLNYFELFSLAPHWRINSEELRRQFLELSGLTHPDRYEALGPPDKGYALRWSTAVNRAYQTLRDPEARTRYFLLIRGCDPDKASPMGTAEIADFAERYFEAQDGPPERLLEFKAILDKELSECEKTTNGLATQWKGAGDLQTISLLADNFRRSRTFQSMLVDLQKQLESKQS